MDNSRSLSLLESDHRQQTEPIHLGQNPAVLYLARFKKNSLRVQRRALIIIADIIHPGADYLSIPWEKIEYPHAQLIRAVLQERYSQNTANRVLSALRETIKQAWLLGQVSAEQYFRIKEIENLKCSKLPAGRYVTFEEINAVMDVCINDEGPAGVRDAAIISWMASGGGPRRSEVAGTDLADYDSQTGEILIRGKGNKERFNYLENGAAYAMADWLVVRGNKPGPLFLPINKGGKLVERRMTDQAIYTMVKRRINQAGVRAFSPHDLRRTFISNMMDVGVDTATISKIVGHKDITTTARYDRRPEETKKRAQQLLTFPYKRRYIDDGEQTK